jgi:hypothetical protein
VTHLEGARAPPSSPEQANEEEGGPIPIPQHRHRLLQQDRISAPQPWNVRWWPSMTTSSPGAEAFHPWLLESCTDLYVLYTPATHYCYLPTFPLMAALVKLLF